MLRSIAPRCGNAAVRAGATAFDAGSIRNFLAGGPAKRVFLPLAMQVTERVVHDSVWNKVFTSCESDDISVEILGPETREWRTHRDVTLSLLCCVNIVA
jgi:hypothetical protein